MKDYTFIGTTALSLAALLSTGCASAPFTQAQLGYAKGRHKKGTDGYVDFLCTRVRGGATVSEKHEFRLGADLCYGKLPKTTSTKTYSVEVPVVGKQETDIEGETTSNVVQVSIPFLEYRLARLEANIPSKLPADWGIRSSTAKDFSYDIWIAGGYSLDITTSETDYKSGGGTVDNIPGVDIQGQFYGEIGHEMIFFGKVPLSLVIRVPQDGKVVPMFLGGYKLQWK